MKMKDFSTKNKSNQSAKEIASHLEERDCFEILDDFENYQQIWNSKTNKFICPQIKKKVLYFLISVKISSKVRLPKYLVLNLIKMFL